MSDKDVVFDPDAETAQMRDLRNAGLTEFTLNVIEDPVAQMAVQFLVQRNQYTLVDLKAAKKDIADLRTRNDTFRDTIQDLRVDLGKHDVRESIFWIEIPLSLLGGYAITLVGNSATSTLGVTLLILVVACLLFLRMTHIGRAIDRARLLWRKVRGNDQN